VTRSVSRRSLFKLGGGAAAIGLGTTLAPLADPEAAEAADTWHSELVYPGPDGRLVYVPDPESGKTIPDFSWAGYRNGEATIPDVPVVKTIGPLKDEEGNPVDCTAHLQQALDEVGAMPMDANGFRGALKLEPGIYEVKTIVSMERSGVVLRGSGRSDDPAVGTILRSTSGLPTDHELGVGSPLWVGGKNGDWTTRVPNSTTTVVSPFVEAGSRRLKLRSAANFKVGDNIIIKHRCSEAWLAAIDHGGVNLDPPWEPIEDLAIVYNRYITAIEDDDVIVVCAPVFNDLDQSLTETVVWKWDRVGLVRNVGVEDLRVDMGDPGEFAENHPDNCINVDRTEDSWIRRVDTRHFRKAGVMVRRSTRVTVEDTWALNPSSRVDGTFRYNFCAGKMSQQILFKNVRASEGRHSFVAEGKTSSSGNVWLDSRSVYGHAESGGHLMWSQGLLFDNVMELDSQSERPAVLNLHNRADAGQGEASQGWSSVYSVLWNCTVNNKTACVQRPPTSQNFAIGTTGTVNGENWLAVEEAGYIEGNHVPGLEPVSLYRAQLADRLSSP
jgi:hypothetical protein